MLNWIARPFGMLMLWLYNNTGSYGSAIIIFAIIVNIILLPFQMKSKKSMMRMTRLNDRVKELERKHAGNPRQYQEAVSELYRKEHVNPASGCLWSFISLPILIALYQAIRMPLTIMMGVSKELIEEGGAIFTKLTELGYNFAGRAGSAYEQIYESKFISEHFADFQGLSDKLQTLDYSWLNFLDLSTTPDWKIWTFDFSSPDIWVPAVCLFLIPVISAFVSYYSMKLSTANQPAAGAQQAQQMKSMSLVMPLMSIWIGFVMPAALGLYWIMGSVIGLVREALLNKVYGKQLAAEDAERRAEELEKEKEIERKRQETERLREAGETVRNENTSKKKIQARESQHEEERKAAERAAMRKSDNKELPASQVGNRRFARGRAYDPERFGEQQAVSEKAAEAENIAQEVENTEQQESIND